MLLCVSIVRCITQIKLLGKSKNSNNDRKTMSNWTFAYVTYKNFITIKFIRSGDLFVSLMILLNASIRMNVTI